MLLDAGTGTVTTFLEGPDKEQFKGVNDLDLRAQWRSRLHGPRSDRLHDRSGRVYRLTPRPAHGADRQCAEPKWDRAQQVREGRLRRSSAAARPRGWQIAGYQPGCGSSTKLATDKRRLVGAHPPFKGTGFVERKDGTYRFVPV